MKNWYVELVFSGGPGYSTEVHAVTREGAIAQATRLRARADSPETPSRPLPTKSPKERWHERA